MSAVADDPFPHSIASFDPTARSVLLWTRTEAGPTVRWVVARDETLRDVVAEGEAAVDPERDHTATVDVDGLEPATTYHYRFEVDGRRSRPGTTRTLPDGPTERARFAVVACANLARAPLTVYRAVAGVDDIDLVLHLGDYIYEDDGARGDIPVDPPHALVTVDDYRRRYRQARRDTDLQQLHERVAFATIWDDHDVADNAFDDGAKAHDPDEHGPWPERKAAAARVRQEWVPARLRDEGREDLLWRSFAFGDLAELVLLDARLGGRDEQPDSAEEDLDDPDRAMLGPEQWRWAEERIADRSRPWCLLASQVPVSEMRLPMPEPLDLDAVLPDGYTLADGAAFCTDQWDGYPAERRRLAELLARRGGGAVVLSADVHSSWVFDGPFGADGEPVAGELTGSSVSSTTMGGNIGSLAVALAERIADGLDHVRWVDLDEHGFIVVDVTRERLRGEMWAVDPMDAEARARRMTAWEIDPGPAARWREADDAAEVAGGEADAPEVSGPAALGPPAGGRLPARRSVGSRLARAALAGAALVALRPVLRALARGARRGRDRR